MQIRLKVAFLRQTSKNEWINHLMNHWTVMCQCHPGIQSHLLLLSIRETLCGNFMWKRKTLEEIAWYLKDKSCKCKHWIINRKQRLATKLFCQIMMKLIKLLFDQTVLMRSFSGVAALIAPQAGSWGEVWERGCVSWRRGFMKLEGGWRRRAESLSGTG